MTERLKRLQEALEIARRHKNRFLEQNLLQAIKEETTKYS